jgi:formylglycine-generating enzyme required for sulfatase activity
MKISSLLHNAVPTTLALFVSAGWGWGQAPVIASFNHQGELVCTNLQPGTLASVQWAPSPAGSWEDVSGLAGLAPNSVGVLRVELALTNATAFYRVQGQGWTNVCLPPFATPPALTWIPCGTFTMGSPPSEPARQPNEGPQTLVTLTSGFWLGTHEVTQGEFLDVMGSNPSAFPGDLTRPVERVNWNDAGAYCAALTAREQAAGRLPAGYAFRLPTEAEWEYACRAGTPTPFYLGTTLRSGMANFDGHYEYPPCGASDQFCFDAEGLFLSSTTPAEGYSENSWGLFGMIGNVAEWCHDYYSAALPGGSLTNPPGAATGTLRIIRGGGFDSYAGYSRSATRIGLNPVVRVTSVGFRVVLATAQ